MSILKVPLGDLLPDLVRDALSTPIKYPKLSIDDSRLSDVWWGSSGHAIYLGKWPASPQVESIYNDEVALALADYVHLQDAEGPIKLVICPQLSLFFNATPQDGSYLEPEAQRAYLQQLLTGRLKIPVHQLKLVFPTEEPRHAILMQTLQRAHAQNPRVGLELTEVFKDFKPGMMCVQSNDLSYQLAGRLVEWAKGSRYFRQQLKDTLPRGLSTGFDEDDNPDESIESGELGPLGYGLTEIAMRLADLIQGQAIQLGVGRQYVYDKVIDGLLKAANPKETAQKKETKGSESKGSANRYSPAILEILALLKGKSFRPIRLKDNQKNYYEEFEGAMKVRAQARSQVVMVLGALLVGGGLAQAYDQHLASKQAAWSEAHLKQCATHFTFTDHASGRVFVHDSSQAFPELIASVQERVKVRYAVYEDLTASITDYLCGSDHYMISAAYTSGQLSGIGVDVLADRYILAHTFSLQNYFNRIERPHSDLLPSIRGLQNQSLKLGDPSTCAADRASGSLSTPVLGSFRPKTYGREYIFYQSALEDFICIEDLFEVAAIADESRSSHGTYSVQVDYVNPHQDPRVFLTAEQAKPVLQAFVDDQRRFDAIPMVDFLDSYREARGNLGYPFLDQELSSLVVSCSDPKFPSTVCEHPFEWNDTQAGLHYQFIVANLESSQFNGTEPLILARAFVEDSKEPFSVEVAKKALKAYGEIPWH